MRDVLPVNVSTVFILSITSDIGEKLALHYLNLGAQVLGTHRGNIPESLNGHPNLHLLSCDVTTSTCAQKITEFLQSGKLKWDLFISCVGQLAPVGRFFETNFSAWAHSVEINSTAQLRALHAAHPFRSIGRLCHIVFFAGGGTNGPFHAYSSYCLGKIALIKMCELLDDENQDLNVFIVGTGWVQTKIHHQTLDAGPRAGANYAKTKSFIDQAVPGTSHADIANMIAWGVSQGREVVGGRNFSILHDAWREGGESLATALKTDPHRYKLRRHGNG